MRRRFALLILLSALWTVHSFARTGAALADAIESVSITVSDLDRAVHFYTSTLSFEKIDETEVDGSDWEHLEGVFGLRMRIARLRLGAETIRLAEYLAPKGRALPADSRSNDRWFQHIAIIVSDMDRAYQLLRAHKVTHASPGPQRLPDWNPNAGGIRAFYFKDPDGHSLEVLQFPAGKGDPKWRRQSDRIFLGIDHTAIVVGDTEQSLRFYRDLIGMRVAGESENFGPEQERLNNVFGARLRITALRASSGPGIEILEYLAPRDGRPIPQDIRANDLMHWETTLLTANAESAAESLRAGHYTFISSGLINKAFLARDPDGHAIRVVEK